MMTLGLSLCILLSSQSDPVRQARELVEKLDDDSIEVRERAAARLVELGKVAIPILTEAQEKASKAVKLLLQETLSRIERREYLDRVLRPTFVKVDAKGAPLREVLSELQKLASAPVELTDAAAECKVTVSLSGVPFWDALDRVCKASGEVMYGFEPGKVVIRKAKYQEVPKWFHGPFAVFLLGVRSREDTEDTLKNVSFEIRLCWENGARPIVARYRLVDARNEDGLPVKDYRKSGPEGGTFQFTQTEMISSGFGDDLTLSAGSTKMGQLKVALDLYFASRWAELTFKNLDGKDPSTARCETLDGTLAMGNVAEGKSFRVRLTPLSTLPDGHIYRTIWVRNKDGTEFPRFPRFPEGHDKKATELNFELRWSDFRKASEQVELTEVRIRLPKEILSVPFEIELKEVP